MSLIERLAWDSRFFRYETGKCEIGAGKDFDYNRFLKNAEPFRLVYVFSGEKLDYEKLRAVGTKIILSQKTSRLPADKAGKKLSRGILKLQSFDLHRHDYKKLEELALESGIHSRFRNDPGFQNDEFQRLYRKWISDSINEALAFDVIVAENKTPLGTSKEAKIQGFVTLSEKNENTAKIGLIAVDKKARNLGVASTLITEALYKSARKGFVELEVATQCENLPAVELYKKTGFKIKESFFVYHFWNL